MPIQGRIVRNCFPDCRRFVWTAVGGFLTINFLMFLRFFFPRTLFEPSSKFRIGYPSDFGLGVDDDGNDLVGHGYAPCFTYW